jgi:transcriptional regulator with XRE-family HTH domain
MTTAKAIATLRAEAKFSQDQLAERLGVTVTSISRYENGREPNRQALKKLAVLSESAGLRELQELFTKRWGDAVARRVESLPSARTQRRLSLDDLKYWSAYLSQTSRAIQRLRITDNVAAEHLRNAAWVMEHIHDEIEVYIDEPWSSARKEEDERLLKSHRMTPPYGIEAKKENQ